MRSVEIIGISEETFLVLLPLQVYLSYINTCLPWQPLPIAGRLIRLMLLTVSGTIRDKLPARR